METFNAGVSEMEWKRVDKKRIRRQDTRANVFGIQVSWTLDR